MHSPLRAELPQRSMRTTWEGTPCQSDFYSVCLGRGLEAVALTFFAVDGSRQQVTLNLLVLLKGTLYLCPRHELMDLPGDLPKFLKGQKICHLKLENLG